MTDKPYGEVLDEMDHEAKYQSATKPLDDLFQEILVTLKHARIFICTREKMHPEGIRQYDALIDRLTQQRTQGGENG
jgi:hypothetical protein